MSSARIGWVSRMTLGCVAVGLALVVALEPTGAQESAAALPFPFKDGDRVAWVGSSSTNIGVWPKTMEFLLRTRHPEVPLTFKKFSTGGGTFATGVQNLDKWLDDFKPTLVFLNYGSNDAGAGENGLPTMKDNAAKCLAKVKDKGARPILTTFQAADVRKSGEAPAAKRKLYAEAMLTVAKEKNWPIADVFHPLEALQQNAEKDDPDYTLLKDKIHLTDPAYVAWGYYLYERLSPPKAESSATLSAGGQVTATTGCQITDIRADKDALSFTRADAVLPILPPGSLPPRRHVPLEKWSAYHLKVTGLAEGKYEIRCEGKPIGTAEAAALAKGVNLNTLLLDGKNAAPWDALAKDIWAGKSLDQIGKTKWRFEVRKQ